MKVVDWSDKVASDFRTRIIIEPDSPILAFKANRDRYTRQTQPDYEGRPYLGSQDSEDALTWNVFRSLRKAGRLDIVCNDLGIGEPRAMLLWALTPESDGASAELQYVVGTVIRKFDRILRGQMTEPDVIISGTKGIAVIECKLGEHDSPLSHLWEGSPDSFSKRLPIYRQAEPSLRNVAEEQIVEIYQLVRMAFYALQFSKYLASIPVVVSLASENNWRREIRRLRKSPAQLWNLFCEAVAVPNLRKKQLTWQRIMELLAGSSLLQLSHYLSTHPCLR